MLLEMFVLKHDEYDVLLGIPWFMATGAGINPSEKTLRFKREIVMLNSSNRLSYFEMKFERSDPRLSGS